MIAKLLLENVTTLSTYTKVNKFYTKILEKQVQKVTDDSTKKIDQLADEKRKEITQG